MKILGSDGTIAYVQRIGHPLRLLKGSDLIACTDVGLPCQAVLREQAETQPGTQKCAVGFRLDGSLCDVKEGRHENLIQ